MVINIGNRSYQQNNNNYQQQRRSQNQAKKRNAKVQPTSLAQIKANKRKSNREQNIQNTFTKKFKKEFEKFNDHYKTIKYKNSKGKGIGSSLMKKAFHLSKENNKHKIRVITQKGNEEAMNYYLKNGFLIHKMEYVYHYWTKK